MRTIFITFIFLIGITSIQSCNTSKNIKMVDVKNYLSDSIKPEIDYTLKTTCSSQFKGYYRFNGFIISNYYLICDRKAKNGDSLCIISPKVFTPEASSCRAEKELIANSRILLLVYKNEKYQFRNVIDNEFNIDCGGGTIKFSDGGFSINKASGQGYSFTYEINVSYIDKDFYVSKIDMSAWRPNSGTSKEVKKEYNYKELKLSEFEINLIDSLRRQFDI